MEGFTWDQLATVAGATALVTLIVQFIKADLNQWVVRLITYLLSLAVLIAGNWISNPPMSWGTALLAAINALVVALAATGSYHVAVKPLVKS